MATVYVKCKPGRRHFYQGRAIPTDKFVPVDPNDPVMHRAIYHWQDLEVEGGAGEEQVPGTPIDEGQTKPGESPPRDQVNPTRQRRERARPDSPGLAPEHQPPASPKE